MKDIRVVVQQAMEAVPTPAFDKEAVQARVVPGMEMQRLRSKGWGWAVVGALVVGLPLTMAAAATPLHQAALQLQQAVLRVLGSPRNSGLQALETGSDWHPVDLVSAANGYALKCSGYYFDGYETAILCGWTVPAAVTQAYAALAQRYGAPGAYGPLLPGLLLTDASGDTLRGQVNGGVNVGPRHQELFYFYGSMQPGEATVRAVGVPVMPALSTAPTWPYAVNYYNARSGRHILLPQVTSDASPGWMPTMRFNLQETTPTGAVAAQSVGAVTLHGIRVSVSEFLASPGTTHLILHVDRPGVTSGSYLEIPLGRGSGVELWAYGQHGLRTQVTSGEMSSGPGTTTANFVGASGAHRFTVEVPRVDSYLDSGGAHQTPQVIQGPWIIPVQIPG